MKITIVSDDTPKPEEKEVELRLSTSHDNVYLKGREKGETAWKNLVHFHTSGAGAPVTYSKRMRDLGFPPFRNPSNYTGVSS